MKNTSVLIIEDESLTALELENFLVFKGYNVVNVVDNCDDAMKIINTQKINIILCDIHIKGPKDSIECVKELKEQQNIEVIYLSAFSDDDTVSRAVKTNPRGYLIKPFNRDELYVALQLASKSEKIIYLREGYVYNVTKKQLSCKNENISLSKHEHTLLNILIQGEVVSSQQIEYKIWSNSIVSDSSLRTLIYRLNHKIKYQLIKNISGVGYKLEIL